MECSPGAGDSDIGQALSVSRVSSKGESDVSAQEDVLVGTALAGMDG